MASLSSGQRGDFSHRFRIEDADRSGPHVGDVERGAVLADVPVVRLDPALTLTVFTTLREAVSITLIVLSP